MGPRVPARASNKAKAEGPPLRRNGNKLSSSWDTAGRKILMNYIYQSIKHVYSKMYIPICGKKNSKSTLPRFTLVYPIHNSPWVRSKKSGWKMMHRMVSKHGLLGNHSFKPMIFPLACPKQAWGCPSKACFITMNVANRNSPNGDDIVRNQNHEMIPSEDYHITPFSLPSPIKMESKL